MNQATKTIQNTAATGQNVTPRTLPHPELKEVNNLTGLPSLKFMDMGVGRKFFDDVVDITCIFVLLLCKRRIVIFGTYI